MPLSINKLQFALDVEVSREEKKDETWKRQASMKDKFEISFRRWCLWWTFHSFPSFFCLTDTRYIEPLVRHNPKRMFLLMELKNVNLDLFTTQCRGNEKQHEMKRKSLHSVLFTLRSLSPPLILELIKFYESKNEFQMVLLIPPSLYARKIAEKWTRLRAETVKA